MSTQPPHGFDAWNALLVEISHRPKRVTERKQDRSKRTEQQILNAALRVFARDGISARALPISPQSRDLDLRSMNITRARRIWPMMSHVASGRIFQAYRQAAESRATAREKLALYLTMSADYAREHAEWARLLP
jgi:hypothetical protein